MVLSAVNGAVPRGVLLALLLSGAVPSGVRFVMSGEGAEVFSFARERLSSDVIPF